MKTYTAHVRRHGLDPERDLVLVPEGFSFWAFLFSAAWLLWHRLWLAAVIVIATHVIIGGLIYWLTPDSTSVFLVDMAIAAIIGFVANDIRRAKLETTGFVDEGVVTGRNLEDAERRFLDNHPALARAMTGDLDGVSA